MNKFLTAALVGGAALAVGILPAAPAFGATPVAPTPIAPSITPIPHDPGAQPGDPGGTAPTAPKPTPKPTPPKPGGHKPTTHEPVTHKPVTHKPVTTKPGSHKPVTKPGSHKPVTHKPTGHKPVTTPTGHKPVTPKPITPKPVAPKPMPPIPAPAPKPVTTPAPGGGSVAQPRILGGSVAWDVPWAAQVAWDSVGFQCSGTVVAPSWVMTAQHCVTQDGMSVRVGTNKLGAGTIVRVDDRVVDPHGDIALLHLADQVDATPVQLADTDPKAGTLNQIFGWGKTSPDSGPAPLLRTAQVKVTGTDCQDAVHGEAICSTGVNGSAFNGDSGGPEMAGGVEVGVCSTGDEAATTEQYASVAASRDWIRQTAGV